MLSDLYVLPTHRRGGAARELIGVALDELEVGDDEPLALLLPISEEALIALPRILGSRRLVGSKGWSSPIFGSLDEIAEASRKLRAALKEPRDSGS